MNRAFDGGEPERIELHAFYNIGSAGTPQWLELNDAAEELEVAADFLADSGFEYASQCMRIQAQALRLELLPQMPVSPEYALHIQKVHSRIMASLGIPKKIG